MQGFRPKKYSEIYAKIKAQLQKANKIDKISFLVTVIFIIFAIMIWP